MVHSQKTWKYCDINTSKHCDVNSGCVIGFKQHSIVHNIQKTQPVSRDDKTNTQIQSLLSKKNHEQ